MKKWLAAVLSVFLLTGCFLQKDNSAGIEAYEGYYKSITDNDRFQADSKYYHISGEMTTLADGTHRYYIFLDEAQIAMYEVVLMAIRKDVEFEQNSEMMPSIGVFEGTDYSLIPYQSRIDKGFVKGLVLSGECMEDSIDIEMLVEWRDKNRESAHREYLSFTLNSEGISSDNAGTEAAQQQESLTHE